MDTMYGLRLPDLDRWSERVAVVRVRALATRRLGPAAARELYADLAPPSLPDRGSAPVARRPRGAGRPTGRDRRRLRRLREGR